MSHQGGREETLKLAWGRLHCNTTMRHHRPLVSGLLLACLTLSSSGLVLWAHHRLEEGHHHEKAGCALCQQSILTPAVILPEVTVFSPLANPNEGRVVLSDEHFITRTRPEPSLPRGPPRPSLISCR